MQKFLYFVTAVLFAVCCISFGIFVFIAILGFWKEYLVYGIVSAISAVVAGALGTLVLKLSGKEK